VLAFFFVTVGMLVSPQFFAEHAWVLLAALAGVLAIKILTTAAALKVLQVPIGMAAGVALALAQIGEFSFVLGQEARSAELISAEAYTFVLALAVLSMLLTPFLVNASSVFARWFGEMMPTPATIPEGLQGRTGSAHAIVVGYGPVGRTLARILRDFGIHPTVIDMNIETVRKLTDIGETALFGDAGRREILQAARVEQATYLLVTLPDLPSRIPVVATARILNPGLKIFVRARYLGERSMLEDAGAIAVSYEEAEVAVSLAGFLLREIGAQPADIEREERRIRAEIDLRTGFTVVLPRPPKAGK
jgi:CPA2 family monovalent cation:H+ antiporter-2